MPFDTPAAAWFWGLAVMAGLEVRSVRTALGEDQVVSPFRAEEAADAPFRSLSDGYVPTFWLPAVGVPSLAIEAVCFSREKHASWRQESSPLLVLWPEAITRIMIAIPQADLAELLPAMAANQGRAELYDGSARLH